MIEEYLRQIDELLSISPAVRDVEIVRRSVRDTDFEKVLNYRYRITLVGGSFVEMTERILEVQILVANSQGCSQPNMGYLLP